MKKYFLLFLLHSILLYPQKCTEHLSGFSMTSLTYKAKQDWFLYLELQSRSIEDFSKPDYYEIKGGAGYNINKNHQAFIGLGRYATYSNSRISREELRLWLQYTYSFNIDRLKIDQRIRAEKRFLHDVTKDSNSDDERYRYRLSVSVPLNSTTIKPETVYLNVFDEIFAGPHQGLLKRNRVYAGIGYVVNKTVNANTGYMWQRELSPSVRNLHFLYFGVNFTLNGGQKETDHRNIAD